MTAFLFFIATFVVIFFIGAKLLLPDVSKDHDTDDLFDPKKDFNIGKALLGIGPALAGFGLIGLVAQNWSDTAVGLRLALLSIALTLLIGWGTALLKIWKASARLRVLGEALIILSTFCLGATIYVGNEWLQLNTGGTVIGISEILGLWSLCLIPLVYLTRSTWVLVINTLVHVVWMATYLSRDYNLIGVFGISPDSFAMIGNGLMFFGLPILSSGVLTGLYIREQNRDQQDRSNQIFTYLIGFMSCLTVGALVWRGIVENDYQFAEGSRALTGGLISSIVTIILFGLDWIGKRTFPRYDISWLTLLAVLAAGITGLGYGFGSYFDGFYFLQTAYTVWLLSDYLRHKNQLAGILFYVFNAVQIWALSWNPEPYSLFQLILLISIMMYAAVIHYRRRGYVTYVGVIGVLAAIVKILSLRLDFNWMLFVLGSVIMAFGVYYTQTRGMLIKDLNNQVKVAQPENNLDVASDKVPNGGPKIAEKTSSDLASSV